MGVGGPGTVTVACIWVTEHVPMTVRRSKRKNGASLEENEF